MNIMLNNKIEGTKERARAASIDISQVIRNVTGVETERERKSVIQQLLEPKEVDEGEKDAKKAAEIARRIARGAHVSPEEKRFLMEVDPRLAQMAELARNEGERIKHAMSQASSKEEQQTIVQQAYQMVQQVSKSNEQFGMLLGEAVKAAVQESRDKESFLKAAVEGDRNQKDMPAKRADVLKEDSQETLLEQFYPEEWMSMLDCKG